MGNLVALYAIQEDMRTRIHNKNQDTLRRKENLTTAKRTVDRAALRDILMETGGRFYITVDATVCGPCLVKHKHLGVGVYLVWATFVWEKKNGQGNT